MTIHPKILSRLFVTAVENKLEAASAAARLGTYVLLGHLPDEVSADPAVITKTGVLPNIKALHKAGVYLDMVCWPLGGDTRVIRVGRDAHNELVIPDVRVSHMHAQLHLTSVVALEDLGSSSGTFHNGERLPPRQVRPLAEKDVFSLGGFEMRLMKAVEVMEMLLSPHQGASNLLKVPAPKSAT